MFAQKVTPIPTWVCEMWGIPKNFSDVTSRKDERSEVIISFGGLEYNGWLTVTKKRRATPYYRLWYSKALQYKIKESFPMSFMRNIERRLRRKKAEKYEHIKIEKDIPFWEFLDIEYDLENRIFVFTPYYTQIPTFPELFKNMLGSPVLHKIYEELEDKKRVKIFAQDWKPRDLYETELGAENVIYFLIDTDNKLLYVGEASNLIKRLSQGHSSIPHWDYYRYECLPNKLEKHRLALERMLIRNYATLFKNKKDIPHQDVSGYRLANIKIDD
ncbi:MAG: GIY-YIG nuclease family protein [Kosmotogaceae bacterium]